MRRILLSTLLSAVAAMNILAQTTAFSYQGSLQSGGSPANGNFDFEFKLFDVVSAGTQQGSTQQRLNVAVANGVFAVSLDFGASTLPGSDRYLDISVRTAGGGAFTQLTPRQKVNSSPYSVRSLNSTTADLATNANQLGGVAANQYVLTGDPRMSDPRPPTAGSSNYIQNGTSPQSSSNFNVSGTGTANIFNATTQYNIGGSRILSNPGTNNLFAGAGAGSAITTGAQNHFFGWNAGAATSMGAFNSFFGNSAGTNNTLGNSNSFFGGGAGAGNLTGGGNSFFGLNAGSSNVFGALNTIIGTGANVGADNLTNATAIGARAFVTQSNSLILGAISGVNNCVPTSCDSVNVGIGTTTPAYPLTAIGTAGSGASQGVVEFSNSANDTGVRIRNSASNGRTYTLFSSGGGSGIGAGNLNIYDATASQSRLTITPNGSVGIGTTSPTFPLSFANIVGDKISLAPNGAASYGFGVQSLLLQVHTDISASDIGFGYGSSSAFTENMRIKGNGNVGIGTASPASVLHLGGNSGSFAMTFTNVANTAGRRGYRLAFDNDRFSFQRADDAGNFAANQVAIDQATGNVGIGTTNPAATLEVNGYTKLGSDAPAIKVMKLTGTTPATEGGFVQVIHGLDPAKILSVSILVNSTFWWIPPHDTGGGSRYSWLLNGNRIEIFNALGDSAQILSKPMRITIMYEQ